MRKILFAAVLLIVTTAMNAQTFTDTFDTNLLGWTEFSGKSGEAIIADGVMHMERIPSKSLFGSLLGNLVGSISFLETHCYAPLDVSKDFDISCEAVVGGVKKGLVNSFSFIKKDDFFGIILDYIDEGNFIVFLIGEGRAAMVRYHEYKVVGIIGREIKWRSEKKDQKIKLEIKNSFNKIEFFVNNMKAVECRYLPLTSNGIGFYMFGGKQVVDFDNLVIIQ